MFEKVQTLNAKINMLVTENHTLKEGQLETIAAAAENRKPVPKLFFKEPISSSRSQMEHHVQVIPKSPEIESMGEEQRETLRGYQVENIRLKDELMQARVERFDIDLKQAKLNAEIEQTKGLLDKSKLDVEHYKKGQQEIKNLLD